MIWTRLRAQILQLRTLGTIALSVTGAVLALQSSGALQLLETAVLDQWFRLRPLESLRGANLIFFNLHSASSSIDNLNNANLSDANLSDAVVEEAQFGGNLGLTEEMKRDLKRRGAIFEDSPGDRSGVLSRS